MKSIKKKKEAPVHTSMNPKSFQPRPACVHIQVCMTGVEAEKTESSQETLHIQKAMFSAVTTKTRRYLIDHLYY